MKFKIFISCTLALLCFIPYQNCSSPEPIDAAALASSSQKFENNSGGNGEYYGGKLTAGFYVRPLPDLKCGASKNLGEITVSEQGDVNGKFTHPSTCLITNLELSASNLEQAAYEPGRVGFVEGIYSKKELAASAPVEKSLVDEAWCRTTDSTASTGFDIIVRADYGKREFRSTVVAGRLVDGRVERYDYASPNLDRDVDIEDRIRYRSGEAGGSEEAFRLDIDTKTFDRSTGKMRALFRFETGPYDTDVNVDCRVGGNLDIYFSGKPYNLTSFMLAPAQVAMQVASLIYEKLPSGLKF